MVRLAANALVRYVALPLGPMVVLFLGATGLTAAQTDQGAWEAPFNHVVPPHWERGQLRWDGEALSQYADPMNPHRFMAGHMALIPRGPHRGKLLVMNWMRKDYVDSRQHWSIVDVRGPVPTFANFSLPTPGTDQELFCGGHAWTQDGDLLMAGGARYESGILKANRLVYRFDPEGPIGNSMWMREPDMDVERWYPTITPMPDNALGTDHLLVSGGLLDPGNDLANKSYESFFADGVPGQGRWEINPSLSGRALFRGPSVPCSDSLGIYPRMMLLSTGDVFSAGMASLGVRVRHRPGDTATPPGWDVHPVGNSQQRWYGSAFLMPNLRADGGLLRDVAVRLGGALVDWDAATCLPERDWIPEASVEIAFAASPVSSPRWRWFDGPSMIHPRNHPSTTLLPDGTVLVTGGRLDTTSQFKTDFPVYEAEIFNETALSWRSLAPAAIRRGYHAATVLLPDGRVLTGGGEKREMDYEIFLPPYLTDGSIRPVVMAPPHAIEGDYGTTRWLAYEALPDGVQLDRVALLRPMACTHHADTNQRYVELDIVTGGGPSVGTGTQRVEFRLPATSAEAPRGDYMLFLITSAQRAASRGTPSEAVWVQLGA